MIPAIDTAFFRGKTYFISGASRGIGKAIALKLASGGAHIIVASKSTEEHPKLGGTIYSAANEIEAAGGRAVAVACDIRDEAQIERAVAEGVKAFGRIDGVINNASAISLSGTAATETKRLDLMHSINVRGTFLVTKHCLPYLEQSPCAHILTLSPPVSMDPRWLAQSVAYTISKYSMTMLAMGWAAEFRKKNIAANALWPVTTIATAAVQNLLGGDQMIAQSRNVDIMADAVAWILQQPPESCTGNAWLDEIVLAEAGITDLSAYAVTPGSALQKDLFID
jgi:citronellol/citronellal dehydrogenase